LKFQSRAKFMALVASIPERGVFLPENPRNALSLGGTNSRDLATFFSKSADGPHSFYEIHARLAGASSEVATLHQ
jgi:hypothetical protein